MVAELLSTGQRRVLGQITRELFVKTFSQREKVFGNFASMQVRLAARGQNLAFRTGRRRD